MNLQDGENSKINKEFQKFLEVKKTLSLKKVFK